MLSQIMQLLRNLHREDKGVTAIEYGLIAALIAIVIIIAVAAVGTGLSTTFDNVAQHVGS